MIRYWVWLSSMGHLRRKTAMVALEHFGTAEEIFHADRTALLQACQPNEKELTELMDKSMKQVDEILGKCDQLNISIVTYQDAIFPNRLKHIENPPLVLYYKGKFPMFDQEPVIAVVGTRQATGYGMLVARRLGYQISACGGLLVSGLAAGIDAMSMIGALNGTYPAVGILGGGVDVVYPASNRALYQDIAVRGCLISEYPPGTRPEKWHFPQRNRILSGLALGVVVVEAPEKSGALITASRALEQGRDVFAVPGNIGIPTAVGTNRLIRDGAIVVENGWDVMKEYMHLYPDKIRKTMLGKDITDRMEELEAKAEPFERWEKYQELVSQPKSAPKPTPKPAPPKEAEKIDITPLLQAVSDDEAVILKALQDKPLQVADLIDACQLKAPQVLASITMLEVRGYVKRMPGSVFALAER